MRVPHVRQLSVLERLAALQVRTRQRREAKAKENSFWWLCLQSDDKLIMIYRGSIDPYKFYLLIISVFYLHFLKILIRIHSILHANRLRFWNWTFQINLTQFTYAHRLIPALGFVHFEYFEWIMLPRQQHVVQHDFSWRKFSCGFYIASLKIWKRHTHDTEETQCFTKIFVHINQIQERSRRNSAVVLLTKCYCKVSCS